MKVVRINRFDDSPEGKDCEADFCTVPLLDDTAELLSLGNDDGLEDIVVVLGLSEGS